MRIRLPAGSRKGQSRIPYGWSVGSWTSSCRRSRARSCHVARFSPGRYTCSEHLRSLSYSMGVSLDGSIAGPRGELDLHLLGRRLYEVMTYWQTAEERNPSAPAHELEFARIWSTSA